MNDDSKLREGKAKAKFKSIVNTTVNKLNKHYKHISYISEYRIKERYQLVIFFLKSFDSRCLWTFFHVDAERKVVNSNQILFLNKC